MIKWSRAMLGALMVSCVALSTFVTISAKPVTGFVAGNIVSDGIFTDYRSMSTNSIQNFLNAKGAACSGNLCLKNYTQSGKKASHIIYEAAQRYRISPKVFIVLVQKEVGLVTDTDPQAWQYRTATGYGCPDTASCDSKYYGFTNQINWSAKMFRSIMDNNPDWYTPYTLGNNRIYFNPDLSRCKNSTVNITSRATVALYSYTPYQPNKAALNAGYGTGDSCSAYGNRNFYLYFSDWFGSTKIPTIFKTSASDQAYLLSGTRYYSIPDVATLEAYGYERTDIKTVSSTSLSGLTKSGSLKTVARFGGDSIYVIDRGRKFNFPSQETYRAYGYVMGTEANLDASLMDSLSNGGPVSTVIAQYNGSAKYVMEGGKRRHISGMTAYTSLGSPTYSSRPTVSLSSTYLSTLQQGTPVLATNTFARDSQSKETFLWNGSTLQAFSGSAVDGAGLLTHTGVAVRNLPTGGLGSAGALVKSGTRYFILDSNQVLELSSSALSRVGLQDSQFISVSTGFIAAATEKIKPFSSVTRINGSVEVYLLENGVRYQIVDPAALYELGYSFSDVSNINTNTAKLFPQARQLIFATGTLVRTGGTNAVYLVTSRSSKLLIPSRAVLYAYGYSLSSVVNVQSSRLSKHQTSGTLGIIVKDASNTVWLVDSKTKRSIPSNYQATRYYNLSTSTMLSLTQSIISKIPTRETMTPILQVNGDPKVYMIENGKRRWVTSRQALESAGYSFADVRMVSSSTLEMFRSGLNL